MKKRWRNVLLLTLSVAFVAIFTYISMVAVEELYAVYPSLPVTPDFFLDNIEFINLSFFSDLTVAIGIFSFLAVISTKKRFKKLPYFILTVGLFQLVRSAMIYFTPMADPFPLESYGFSFIPDGGMLPSGHTGLLFLFTLFSCKEKIPKPVKIFFIILLFTLMALLLISHAHYTNDIITALFIAYALYKLTSGKIKEKLILD